MDQRFSQPGAQQLFTIVFRHSLRRTYALLPLKTADTFIIICVTSSEYRLIRGVYIRRRVTENPAKPVSQEMAESTKAPKEVFLSYGRDPQRVNGFVQKLQSDLEAEGISVWRDTDDIDVGSDWHNKIADGVYNCRALLCVLTNKYINSRNCRGELFYANEKKKLIFPVLYEDIAWDKDANSRGVGYVVNSFNRAEFRPSKVDYQVAVKNLIEAMKGQGKYLFLACDHESLPYFCVQLCREMSTDVDRRVSDTVSSMMVATYIGAMTLRFCGIRSCIHCSARLVHWQPCMYIGAIR